MVGDMPDPRSRILSSLGFAQINHLPPVRHEAASLLVRDIYRQVERDFGVLAPPVVLHAPAPEVLAAAWSLLRETMLAPGSVERAAKEAVAAAVSRSNECTYCVVVHDHVRADLLRRAERPPSPSAAAEQDTVRWLTRVGEPAPPLAADQLAELVAVAVLMHYLNRMVAVFLDAVPLPAPAPRWLLDPVVKQLGRVIGDADRRVTSSGSTAAAPAPPVPDLWWAGSRAPLHGALAAAATVIDDAGARTVPAPVRELLDRELGGWDARQRGPGLSWATDACSSLPVTHRAIGRLVLLFAFAPHAVDRADLVATGADDRELVEIGAWASLTTGRRIGTDLARRSDLGRGEGGARPRT